MKMELEKYMKFYEEKELENFFNLLNGRAYVSYCEYVLEMLENEVVNWKPYTPIYIIAPTGCGKNTFIEWMAKNYKNESILLLSNRVALNRQIKIRMIKNLGYEHFLEELTDAGLDCLENIGNVTIKTYHKYFLDVNLKKEQKSYKYIVADECQFLDSDSTFVPYTNEILKMIVSNRNAVRIYMTATPDFIFESILNEEFKSYINSLDRMVNFVNYCMDKFTPICYELKKDLKLIGDLKFYRDIVDLVPIISKDSTKWFVFIDSITKGEEFCSLLSTIGKSHCLITSDSKKCKTEKAYAEYVNITNKEAFNCDVIISTKTLENGINLKIPNLKNIVINDVDYTSLLQKLGRKRMLNQADKINLFVKIPSLKEVVAKKYICEEQMKKMSYLKNIPSNCVESFINSEEFMTLKNNFFFKNGKIMVNELAWKKLKRDHAFYEMLISAIKKEELAPALLIKHWIYKTDKVITVSESDIIDGFEERQESIEYLCSFINHFVGRKLDDDEVMKFRKEFMDLYLKHFEKENTKRTDRVFGKNIISSIIKELCLPYEIKTMDKKWFIKKGESNHEAK